MLTLGLRSIVVRFCTKCLLEITETRKTVTLLYCRCMSKFESLARDLDKQNRPAARTAGVWLGTNPAAKRAPALRPIKLKKRASAGGGRFFADHYRPASAITVTMIAAEAAECSARAPQARPTRVQ